MSLATITVWLLIATTNTHTSPTNIAQFATEKDCLMTAATMQRLSREKSGMMEVYGICVEAKIVK